MVAHKAIATILLAGDIIDDYSGTERATAARSYRKNTSIGAITGRLAISHNANSPTSAGLAATPRIGHGDVSPHALYGEHHVIDTEKTERWFPDGGCYGFWVEVRNTAWSTPGVGVERVGRWQGRCGQTWLLLFTRYGG